MRKILCLMAVCLLILGTAVLPVSAAAGSVITISSAEEFLAFAQSCRLDAYSIGKQFSLQADIDLEGIDFQGIPIFGGEFQGNGYTVSGLSLTHAGSAVGLFRSLLPGGEISGLNVEGLVHPEGDAAQVGGIVGRNAGIIRRCSFSGYVGGADSVGGIAGSNDLTGIVVSCSSHGSVHGTHFAGGITGLNNGVVRSCRNHAQVNTTVEQNSISLEDISLQSITSSESAATVTDIGGICGSGSGVIRGCENHGAVGYPKVGYNIGGIAGSFSGYLYACVNYAEVNGRKEVGGILGQLEPAVSVRFDEDTLQTLQKQMEQMAATTRHTAATAQAGAASMKAHFDSIEQQIALAQEAMDSLLPSPEDPALPDEDALEAARNALSSSMASIAGSLSTIGTDSRQTLGSLYQNVLNISGQVNSVGGTIGSASENLGGSVADVSDADTPEDTLAKVAQCRNLAPVSGDWNIGGIVGAISMENDLDPEDDIHFDGAYSMNFDAQLRAVVTDCDNTGPVTASKSSSGGISGWMSMGLVKNCLNTADILSPAADHVGGIAGRSEGYIRNCLTKCAIEADSCVGGIAGSGKTVSDCKAMVFLMGVSQEKGAILGSAQDLEALSQNHYLPIGADIGAVDGINYAQKAESMEARKFLQLPQIPESFSTITVTFRFEDGTAATVTTPFASMLAASKIPQVPVKANNHGTWAGSTGTRSQLFFDTEFTASYTPYVTTISSTASNGTLPLVLAQGAFTEDFRIPVTPKDDPDALYCWTLSLPQSSEPLKVRLLLPEGLDADQVALQVMDAQNNWTQVDFQRERSYLVFSASQELSAVRLVEIPADYTLPLVLGGCLLAIVLIAAITLTAVGKKKKKK